MNTFESCKAYTELRRDDKTDWSALGKDPVSQRLRTSPSEKESVVPAYLLAAIIKGDRPLPYDIGYADEEGNILPYVSKEGSRMTDADRCRAPILIMKNRKDNDANTFDETKVGTSSCAWAPNATVKERHIFAVPNALWWDDWEFAFNAVTFKPRHIPRIQALQRALRNWATMYWDVKDTKEVDVCFHVGRNASIRCLHAHGIHAVAPFVGPSYAFQRSKNISADGIIAALQS